MDIHIITQFLFQVLLSAGAQIIRCSNKYCCCWVEILLEKTPSMVTSFLGRDEFADVDDGFPDHDFPDDGLHYHVIC